MSTVITFFVPGVAEGKAEPDTTRIPCKFCHGAPGNKQCPSCHGMGGWNRKYLNAKSKSLIAHIRSCFERKCPGHMPFTGPVRVSIVARFAPNKGDSKTKWLSEHLAMHETPYVKKPDADNIHKSLDALTGIAWHDDAQIFQTSVLKRYCLGNENPGTEIMIEHCPELIPQRGV